MLFEKWSIVLQTTDGKSDDKILKYKFTERVKSQYFSLGRGRFGFKESASWQTSDSRVTTIEKQQSSKDLATLKSDESPPNYDRQNTGKNSGQLIPDKESLSN